jgi:hypothetical protein
MTDAIIGIDVWDGVIDPADVSRLWRDTFEVVAQRMGVEDDGSGEERIAVLRDEAQRTYRPPCSPPCQPRCP